MRCTSTNKFASFDEPEVTLEQDEIDGCTYSASVRVVRPCAECGEEAAEYTFELEQELECPTCADDPADGFELIASEDPTCDESGGSRYKKNMFTAEIAFTAKCTACGTEIADTVSNNAAASWFDSLVD